MLAVCLHNTKGSTNLVFDLCDCVQLDRYKTRAQCSNVKLCSFAAVEAKEKRHDEMSGIQILSSLSSMEVCPPQQLCNKINEKGRVLS